MVGKISRLTASLFLAVVATLPFSGSAYATEANLSQIKEFHGEKYTSPDGKHSAKVTEQFVELGVLEGETVSIDGNQAIWKDTEGNNISTISFSPEDPANFHLAYDPTTHRVGDRRVLHPTGERCASKWQAAGLNIAWDGLVCGPLTLASAGTLAAACGVAGTLGAAAISC